MSPDRQRRDGSRPASLQASISMYHTAHKQQVDASEQAPLPQVHQLSLLSEGLCSAVVFDMQLLHSGLSVGHSSSAVSSCDVGSASQ